MNFTETLAQLSSAAEQTIELPEGWGQGRALFGGFTAAIAWQAAHYGATEDQSLRAFTVSFVGPVAPGPVTIIRRVLREGKSVTQLAVELIQQQEVVLTALASYGRDRDSKVQVEALAAPVIPGFHEGPGMPDLEQVPSALKQFVPEFTQHFDYRVNVGGLPFSGQKNREFGGWMRFSQEAEPISVGYLLGLVDAWPPALLPHLNQPAPASSLTWTIEFIEPLPAKTSHDWWQYIAHIDHAGGGYGHTHATIWDDEGRLVALSRQTVTVFG